jgi:hypothetical protein
MNNNNSVCYLCGSTRLVERDCLLRDMPPPPHLHILYMQ